MATRSSAKAGSPRQALNYITDGHDARRDPSYSDAELHYTPAWTPGWKTDLEGGRVPLVGFGALVALRTDSPDVDGAEGTHQGSVLLGPAGLRVVTALRSAKSASKLPARTSLGQSQAVKPNCTQRSRPHESSTRWRCGIKPSPPPAPS
jgi:hypothetical protein